MLIRFIVKYSSDLLHFEIGNKQQNPNLTNSQKYILFTDAAKLILSILLPNVHCLAGPTSNEHIKAKSAPTF